MQQCQDQLEFRIETPDDREIARRFANRQKALAPYAGPKRQAGHKTRNRKSKQQKRQERMNRPKLVPYRSKLEPEAIELECEGFEIAPDTGIMSGCDQSNGDCVACGK